VAWRDPAKSVLYFQTRNRLLKRFEKIGLTSGYVKVPINSHVYNALGISIFVLAILFVAVARHKNLEGSEV